MSDIADRSRREWFDYWRRMNDDELTDERIRIYDAHEVADPDSELDRFLHWAIKLINAIEGLRRFRDQLRLGVLFVPYLDPDAFADAFIALTEASRKLGSDTDAEEIFRGALEVAKARARIGETNE